MEIHVTAENSPYLLDLSKVDTDNFANSTINIMLDVNTVLNLPPVENVKGCPFITVIANPNMEGIDARVNCAEGDTFMFNNTTQLRLLGYVPIFQARPMFKNIWTVIAGFNWD